MTKFKKFTKENSLINMMINETLITLPTPMNISYWWNFGSILGLFLLIQIISGFMLSMHYCPNTELAFKSIIHIIKDVNSGWIIRNIHMNGATFYFICMYLHIARNIFYQCYFAIPVWNVGILILLLSMGTAFMGYVLPWGQMSFWGATVITNLLSAIPYIGPMFVQWIWGGFSINNATLNRFFSLHFILPFVILILVIIHLYFLHKYGSSNPIGVNSNFYKIPFHPYFTIKDILGFLVILFLFTIIILQYPYLFNDPDNFIEANPMNTPPHIKPEWYFLFAYSILRAIPNKLGGVVALIMSILILIIMPYKNKKMFKSNTFYPLNQMFFWIFISNFIMLTWLGGQLIEYPYIKLNYSSTQLYFMYFFSDSKISKIWDSIMTLDKTNPNYSN